MGKFLIELTDDRFKTDDNRDVIEFIRVVNPFAHSDVGSMLIELGKELDGVTWYCPVPSQYAYAVLHSATHRIFAIAYDMNDIAFRLPNALIQEALADDGVVAETIGAEWVRFDPWPAALPGAVARARIKKWCAAAWRAASDRAPTS
jgi:hypothetical protein